MFIEVLCKVIQHGAAYGTKGQVIEVPDEVGASLIKQKKAKAVKNPDTATKSE